MSDSNRPEILAENSDEPRRPALNTEAADSGADSLDAPLLDEARREEYQPRRSKIRSAIASVYAPRRPEPAAPPPPAEISHEQPSSISEPDPAALKLEAARLLHAQADSLVIQAQNAAKDGQIDEALRILSQAVRLDPEHSMAWTWLGGLLINRNLERAQFCLKRAVELDPENQAAKKGLEGVEARLNPPAPAQEPPEIEDETKSVPKERALTLVDDDETLIQDEMGQTGREPDPTAKSIGATELAVLEPTAVPPPPIAAKIKPQTHGRNRSLLLVGLMLGFVMLCGAIGLWFTVAPPYFGPAEPTPTTVPTLPPTPDELLAQRLRNQVGRYNILLAKSNDLRSRFDKGELRWDDLRKEYRDLQNSVKDEKKQVDGIVRDLTPRLQPVYRILQNVADVMITATDYRISGLDNTSPEDLNESDRQYALVSQLLTESLRRLNEVAPPTPTATPASVSVEITAPPTSAIFTTPPATTEAPTTSSPTTVAPTTVAPTTALPPTTSGP